VVTESCKSSAQMRHSDLHTPFHAGPPQATWRPRSLMKHRIISLPINAEGCAQRTSKRGSEARADVDKACWTSKSSMVWKMIGRY